MKALVVGHGRMGGFHKKVLQDYGHEVLIVDPYDTSTDFATIAEARIEHDFDLAAIACPIGFLATSAYQLAGTRMLVEKPFAANLQEAEMLAAYLEKMGAPVCVGYVERFNPRVQELREAIRSRDARPVKARFVRYSDRPQESALDLLSHDLDLARYLGIGLLKQEIDFDTLADQPEKVRRIEIQFADGDVLCADLMDHNVSPLHGLWHEFLHGAYYPQPQDAIAVFRGLEILELFGEMAEAA